MDKKKKPTEPVIDKNESKKSDVAETEATEAKQPVTKSKTDKAAEVQDAKPESYTLTAEEFDAAKAHIEALQKEKDETVILLQRIQADFDNFRKRNTSIRKDSFDEGKRECIKELLPVLDSFDRAMESVEENNNGMQEGVALVQKQMLDALKKLGLCIIEAEGQFDPNEHEAVMSEKVEGKENGEILQVLQKGYRVDDKIIRHCMVKVAE